MTSRGLRFRVLGSSFSIRSIEKMRARPTVASFVIYGVQVSLPAQLSTTMLAPQPNRYLGCPIFLHGRIDSSNAGYRSKNS